MVYFIANIYYNEKKDRKEYEGYVKKVKPIVESYGGEYLVRSDNVIYLSKKLKPDRIIIIRWKNKEQLDKCFNSEEYKKIMHKRTDCVESQAVILEV
ncbi:MAG: DUF1330 domain-containing protein [Lachnospirales bacterium]